MSLGEEVRKARKEAGNDKGEEIQGDMKRLKRTAPGYGPRMRNFVSRDLPRGRFAREFRWFLSPSRCPIIAMVVIIGTQQRVRACAIAPA